MKKLLTLLAFTTLVATSFAQTAATELTAQDTRNSASTPDTYYQNLQLHFKYSPAVGLPPSGNNYSSVLGIRAWIDNSGGKAHELAFSDDGQMRIRSGWSPTWDGWRRILSEDNNGYVGIGTINPEKALHVVGTNADAALVLSTPSWGGVEGTDYTALDFTYGGLGTTKIARIMATTITGGGGNLNFQTPTGGTSSPYTTKMTILREGNIGIGTASPNNTLEVSGGALSFYNNVNGWTAVGMDYNAAGNTNKGQWRFRSNVGGTNLNTDLLVINRVDGNVGIGIADPQYKLAVNGDMAAKKIKVTQTPWADYVFESAYQLPTLGEVEQFIKRHKHLPGILSAKEVEKEGIDVGESQAALLKKVEELTLYVIAMQKQIDQQSKTITDLKQQVDTKQDK